MQCAKEGCQKQVDPGRKYCSRGHAPFGNLVDPQPKPQGGPKSLYKRKREPEPLHCEHGKSFTDGCAECRVMNLEKERARLHEEFMRVTLELESANRAHSKTPPPGIDGTDPMATAYIKDATAALIKILQRDGLMK